MADDALAGALGQLIEALDRCQEAQIEAAVARALARYQPAQHLAEPRTMSLQETARELDAHPQTVRRWIRGGKLRARRTDAGGSGRLLVDVASIRAMQGVRS